MLVCVSVCLSTCLCACMLLLKLETVFGPILDDRLKEKILKHWKGALSSHSVCVSVRPCVNPWYINFFLIRWLTKIFFCFWTDFDDFFSHYSSSCLDSKTYHFFFYDQYDVRYGHFSTSGVSKNHVFSSFWLTAFLLDFCPTFFWSKIDAWDNSYWNYISPC